MPLFSVIVPVFNSDKFLVRCIDSILQQSVSDFELILVDDGSKDESARICNEYSIKDHRVRVFHKENGGTSSARNLGLDQACGLYVCFIDSDDTVGENYLDILKPICDEDFVQSGVQVLENDYLKPIMTHDEIFADYNRFWMESRQVWAVNSCFSKKIIDDYHLRYDSELRVGEDSLFNHIFISKCKKLRRTICNEYYYNSDNLESVSHKYYTNRLEQQVYLIKQLQNFFKDQEICRVIWDYWHEVINHYQVKGVSNTNKQIRNDAKKKLKQTYQHLSFRKCVPYIRSKGSLDEIIETFLMSYYLHWLFKPILKMMKIMSKAKNRK